jgi:hypothetical protein
VKPGERKVKKKRKEEEERIEERKGRPGRKEEKRRKKKKEFEIFFQKIGGEWDTKNFVSRAPTPPL